MINKIQHNLQSVFPEFQSQKALIDYYVSFEFPDKQRKMISWWEAVIEETIRCSNELSLSISDLQTIFTVHRLKPVPLPNILKQLEKEGKVEWEGKKEEERGWFSNFFGKMWSTNANKNISEKKKESIRVVKYYQEQKKKLKSLIQNEVRDENIIDFDFVREKIARDIYLSENAVQILLTDLRKENEITFDEVQGKSVVIYSKTSTALNSRKWVEVQKSKHLLRKKIEYFQILANKKQRTKEVYRENAKDCLAQKNQGKAKIFVQNIHSIDKILKEVNNRKKLLEQTLHQLELMEVDTITIDTMKNCHQIIEKTKVNPNQFEEVLQKHEEININQKERTERMKEMQEKFEDSQEVDELMAELENQIIKEKKKKVQLQEIKVETKLSKEKVYDKNINMDIQ